MKLHKLPCFDSRFQGSSRGGSLFGDRLSFLEPFENRIQIVVPLIESFQLCGGDTSEATQLVGGRVPEQPAELSELQIEVARIRDEVNQVPGRGFFLCKRLPQLL